MSSASLTRARIADGAIAAHIEVAFVAPREHAGPPSPLRFGARAASPALAFGSLRRASVCLVSPHAVTAIGQGTERTHTARPLPLAAPTARRPAENDSLRPSYRVRDAMTTRGHSGSGTRPPITTVAPSLHNHHRCRRQRRHHNSHRSRIRRGPRARRAGAASPLRSARCVVRTRLWPVAPSIGVPGESARRDCHRPARRVHARAPSLVRVGAHGVQACAEGITKSKLQRARRHDHPRPLRLGHAASYHDSGALSS